MLIHRECNLHTHCTCMKELTEQNCITFQDLYDVVHLNVFLSYFIKGIRNVLPAARNWFQRGR